jgi:hypothetical protein
MSFSRPSLRAAAVVAVPLAVAAVAIPGVAMATGSSNTTFYACLGHHGVVDDLIYNVKTAPFSADKCKSPVGNGTVISWNSQGVEGVQGATGTTGPAGAAGAPGQQGEPGAKGEQGEPGAKGEQGEPGAKGEQGEPGAKGEQGEPGVAGSDGADGVTGFERVSFTTRVDGNDVERLTVACPIGKVAVSGGTWAPSRGVIELGGVTTADLKSWTVKVRNTHNIDHEVNAYALCATINQPQLENAG